MQICRLCRHCIKWYAKQKKNDTAEEVNDWATALLFFFLIKSTLSSEVPRKPQYDTLRIQKSHLCFHIYVHKWGLTSIERRGFCELHPKSQFNYGSLLKRIRKLHLICVESDHCLVQMAYKFNSISRQKTYQKRAVMKDVLALGFKKKGRQRPA